MRSQDSPERKTRQRGEGARGRKIAVSPCRRVAASLLLLLFLIACSNNAAAPTLVPTAAIAPSAAAVQPTSTLPITNTPAALIPTEPAATPAANPTDAPAEIAPDATASLPTAEPTVAFNGKNEDGTFFRGRADAPVTLIDYSDFL